MRRTGWVLATILLFVPSLYALDVQVGSSFIISGITRKDGKISLPVERKKYHNIRILNRDTYRFVLSCQEPCLQRIGPVEPAVLQVRSARSQDDLRIVSVRFNRAWLMMFLVSKDGETWHVSLPKQVTFTDAALWEQTRKQIVQAVSEEAL